MEEGDEERKLRQVRRRPERKSWSGPAAITFFPWPARSWQMTAVAGLRVRSVFYLRRRLRFRLRL